MSQPTNSFSVDQIGTLHTTDGFSLVVAEPYRQGLAGLDGFGHVVVLWIAHNTDEGSLVIEKPYVGGPGQVGVFSTRSETRPNRLGLSVAPLLSVDASEGVLALGWIDALDQTPVVDIKPYFPSSDRVQEPSTPASFSHWPQNLESSSSFDWDSVFT